MKEKVPFNYQKSLNLDRFCSVALNMHQSNNKLGKNDISISLISFVINISVSFACLNS